MAPRPSNLEPRWPQDTPTWSQNDPKTLQLGAKMLPSGPKTCNLEPTCPPRAPNCLQLGHLNPLKPLKNQRFLKVFATSTDLQHDAKKQANMMPKTSQHGAQDMLGVEIAPRPSNLEPRWSLDPPTWSQDGPKTLQLGAATGHSSNCHDHIITKHNIK